jgi:hypothetical protein
VTTIAAPRTAGELLEEGMCTARCLLALSARPCGCPCGGRWHGALTGADVGAGASPDEQAGNHTQRTRP